MIEWEDIAAEVERRLRVASSDLENALLHDDVARCQGRIRAFREVLAMPEYFKKVTAMEEKGAMTSG